MKLYHKDVICFLVLIFIPIICGVFLFDIQLKIVELHENYDSIDDIIYEKSIERYMTDSIFLIFGMITFMIFVVVFTMTFSTYSILANVKKIKETTTKISNGDFKSRISLIDTNDEVSQLCNDINEMGAKLMELQEKLIKSERFSAIGQLSARLAHDIRNPLAVIEASLDNIRIKHNDLKFVETSMLRCTRAITRITHQIDDVMLFLKDSPLNLESISLSDILQSIVNDLEITDGIKINLPETDITIQADNVKITSLFDNLILNAVQAIDGKGIITIRCFQLNDIVQIEFENDGPAILDDNMDVLFDPLFTTKQVGTGLGLASCKNILEQHGGVISVTNNPVIFKIILPIKQK